MSHKIRPKRCPIMGRLSLRSNMLIGYARVSTAGQDLTAQRQSLTTLGVDEGAIHVDHGLTGTKRDRPGLREALAACRAGDTLVVTKLDRLARSLPDARDIADTLARKQVALSLGGTIYDPTDPVGKLLFRDYRSNGVRGVHVLLVLRRWHAVGEGDGEGVQSWLPPHGPSCLTGALGV
jgi:hypothetical protein